MVKAINVKKRNGRVEQLDVNKINTVVERACKGLSGVSSSEVVLDAHIQFFDKITTSEIDKALILSAREKISKHYNYNYVANRLFLSTVYKEVFNESVDSDTFKQDYKSSFIKNTKKLVKAGRLTKDLLNFDLKKLAEALVIKRDDLFKYLGSQILYDRYFLHINGARQETPQAFWMRVAMGLALNEPDKELRAIEFYDVLSQHLSVSSTPTLFNSGTNHPQMSSCYLSTQEDSLDGIFRNYHLQARMSKYAGGLGVDYTPCRSNSSYIQGTNGKSNGVIPWIKIMCDTALAVNQGGKRNGACCVYLQTWHADILDFLDLRKPVGDDRYRTVDLNLANFIPDLFFKKLAEDSLWYLFSPDETPELIDLYGAEFESKYDEYLKKGQAGDLKVFNSVKAKELWKKILSAQIQFGGPWITFKDPINVRNPLSHWGSIRSSNLCVETTLISKPTIYSSNGEEVVQRGETAVCNLQALNLGKFVKNKEIQWGDLANVINTSIRMLDNVIDINFYPIEEARVSNLRHRPIMLGIMGWHDLLLELDIPYESRGAVELAGELQEFISYNSIKASVQLSREKGRFETFEGSTWSKGQMPQDTYKILCDLRGVEPEVLEKQDWDSLRKDIQEHGMRNSHVSANQPTATISYIVGCSQSFEPYYKGIYTYSTLSGEVTVISEPLFKDLEEAGLLDATNIAILKECNGDVSLTDLPENIKFKYKTPFNIDYKIIIDANAIRQIWIDQSQSLNLFSNTQSLKYHNDMYLYAFEKMCKTTYYLRSKSATDIKIDSSVPESKITCSLEDRANGCEVCQ